MELKYSRATTQTIDLVTNATGIVRFAQTGDTTYSYVISGGGQLEKTSGTFSLGADTDLQFELGTASDLVNLTSGTLNIGSATLGFDDFSFTGGAGFEVGQYTLFQTTNSILGTFAGNTSGTVGSFNGVIKFSGNDLILDVSVIPEPGTASLLLLGGFSALLLVRRKRHCVEGEN